MRDADDVEALVGDAVTENGNVQHGELSAGFGSGRTRPFYD
jgi:hypothetical protein